MKPSRTRSKVRFSFWKAVVIAAALVLVSGAWFWLNRGQTASAAAQAAKPKIYRNFDIRSAGLDALARIANVDPAAVAQRARAQAQASTQALTRLRASAPGAELRLSPLTAAAEVLRSPRSLTGPNQNRSGADIVRSFLAENRAIYGLGDADLAQLNYLGESISRGSGLRMVRVEQRVNDRPIFQSETRFVLDREGRLIRSTGLFIPNAAANTGALKPSDLLSAPRALQRALAAVGITADASQMTTEQTSADGLQTEVVANHDNVLGRVPSKLVYFPVAPGVLVPAWSQIVFTDGAADWYLLTAAVTGDPLWRKNIRNNQTQDARFRVYVQTDGKTPADSTAPQSPNTVAPGSGMQFPEIATSIVSMNMVKDPLASSFGWITDCPGGGCTANETQTLGNNVLACLDRTGGADANICDTNAAGVLDGNGRPTGNPDSNSRNRDFLGLAPRDFQTGYLPPPQAGNPEGGQTATGAGSSGANALDQYRRGAVTQLFYISNWYHDQLYALGFDEPAGNFQQLNNTGVLGGVPGDRVLADAQDGSGTNNANFATPPDGVSGRMQMFRFTAPTVDRDGGLDAEIVIHELTHGLSNRLVGNAAGLNWDVGGAMGEGWSDFYALAMLNNTNADNPAARYPSGSYATYKLGGLLDNYVYGIRRFPFTTDNTVNPLTWADIDDVTYNQAGGIAASPLGFENNGAMEVHNGGELWTLSLWEMRARIIAANGGNVPVGNQLALQIVTDAMKMTPINPSFVEARDALIDADCAANACANEQSIWGGFADRGLGHKALAPLGYMFGYVGGHLGIQESFALPNLDLQTVTVDDSSGNNNGAIDPGEPIRITVTLNNPWRQAAQGVASATATLTAVTAGVTVFDNSSTYGAIPAQGSAAGDTFLFTVPTSATCGQSLDFTLATASTLGAGTLDIKLRVGAPSGTGAPITYTRTIAGGLAIPDDAPRGVFDSQTVTDDFEIADINFRVDNLTHTFTGDLTVLLKAPNGYGVDYVSLIGGLTDGGPGDNLTNMVIDDDLPAVAANDMVQATAASAPFTDDWLPTFNSPWSNLAGFGPSDPVGQLSRLDGTSTRGVWTVHASDQFFIDTGTLNSWSLIVTPRAFACTPFTPMAAVTGTKTVAGSFTAGGAITYTVTLTNNGTGAQADNAGNEFTDVLPAQLTLVSASATSGTAVATVGTNTVTWNGALAPLGGSVTITINATVKTNASGQMVSNQGTISFDANLDGTNEATALTDDPGVVGASDPTVFMVSKANTTAAITADNPDPSVIGQTVTVNYTVTPVAPATGTPTGNVTVTASTSESCMATVAAGSCTITFNTPGARTLTATYAGDTQFNPSPASAAEPHTVNKANTTAAITADAPDPSVVGQNYTVTASVTVVAPGAGTPTGTITVSDGTNTCTITLPATSCTLPSTTAGVKNLTATYNGDANFNASPTSAGVPHTVNKADTTAAITSDTPDPSVVGQNYTVTASVAVNAPGVGTPTGTITVTDGVNNCTITLPATSCTLPSTTAGSKNLTATYNGDANFNASPASTSAPHTVNKASTTATITADTPDPSVVGQNYTVTASVAVTAPGAGTPTGTITVTDGTNNCTITLPATTCTLPSAAAGAKTLTATYNGDANFNASPASAGVAHTVNKADTTTTITADNPDPSLTGQVVTVSYTVTTNAPGSGTPTGFAPLQVRAAAAATSALLGAVTVTASTGETCSGTVAAGSCTITFNTPGARALTATYAGDANFNSSTSAAVPHNVENTIPQAPRQNLAKLFPDDPLLCAGAAINGSFGQTNSTAAPASGRVFVTLERLVITPGSIVCTLTPAAGGATAFCGVENGLPTWRGTLAAGQRVDVTYQAQIPEGVTTNVCSTASSQFPEGLGPVLSAAQFCLNINCTGLAGPGQTPDVRSIINDGKPGSVLIYNAYTSSATGANFAAAQTTTQNTRINLTNTSTTAPVFVHLFFVDGSTCAVADSYLCLTANQTASFLASDLDPGTSGYLVAVAVDRTGCPIVFNHLIGDEYVKFASGHAANLAAEAIAAIPGGLTFCDPGSDTALLRFDGVNYNGLPHVVAVDNVPSRLDGNDTLLILNRLGGSLLSGAATLGTVVGIFYDDAENALSFVFTAGTCQVRSSFSNSFPRLAPRFEQFVPAGRSGWLKLYVPPLVGVSGAVINLSTNASGFNQGHNLHKLTLTNTTVYTIPVFPPAC